MIKRFCLVLLAVLLFCSSAAAQEAVVGTPRLSLVDEQQETAINLPQPGTVKTTIPVTAGNETADAFLVTALYDTISNVLVSVDMQTCTVESGQTVELSAQLPVHILDGYEYQYFLWDSINGLRPYQVPEREILTEDPLIASSVLEETPIETGVTFKDERINEEGYSPGDYRTDSMIYQGRYCRASRTYEVGENATRTSFYYFTVDKDFVSPTEKNVTFEIVYFDNGTNKITIQYLGPDEKLANKQLSSVSFARKNTNTWRLATISIADANFIEGGVDWISFGAQFRLTGGNDTYIHSVKVYPTQNAQYQAPYVQLGEGMLAYQMSYTRGGNTSVTYQGNNCDKAEAGGSFLFDMQYPKYDEKTILYPMTNVQAEVDITYYDDGTAGNLNVTYKSTAGEQTATVAKAASEGWKTKTVRLIDAVFDRSVDGHDFVVSTQNTELYIQTVSIRIIPPKTGRINFEEGVADGIDFFLRTGTLETSSDAYTEEAVVGPENDKRTTRHAPNFFKNEKQSWKFLYLLVDDALMYGAAQPTVDISVTYYDIGKGNISLQYNAADNAYKNMGIGTKTNTKEWKTITVRLHDAQFTNGQGDYHADFRFSVSDTDGADETVAEEDRLQGLYVSEVTVTPVTETTSKQPAIYLIGDSICQAYAADSIRKGWGEYISSYLTDAVTVENYAVAGKSTKNFLDTGNFETVLSQASPGDYLFIQFGHNDSMSDPDRHTDVNSDAQDHSSYSYNLQYYAQKAWEKGMYPVLLTSIRSFKTFGSDGKVTDDGIDPYRNEMIAIGEEIGVPVVDVGAMHRALMNEWGAEASQKLCDDLNDGNHLNAVGADEIAKLILRGVRENSDIRIFQDYFDPAKSLEAVKPE